VAILSEIAKGRVGCLFFRVKENELFRTADWKLCVMCDNTSSMDCVVLVIGFMLVRSVSSDNLNLTQ